MRKIFPFLLLALMASCNDKPSKAIDIQQASKTSRFVEPDGVVAPDALVDSLELKIENRFPIWREDIVTVAVDLSIQNKTKSHLPARVRAHLFIHDLNTKEPLYWTDIDLAYGETAKPNHWSIISLPVGASKDLVVPILDTKWADVSLKSYPVNDFYSFVPSGKYLMRLELDLYDETDNVVGTAVSNFIQFTTSKSTPQS